MKKIDDILTKPMVAMAIQGMWISGKGSGSISSLPFGHCVDQQDVLVVFEYHDPRMLIELAERRMVEGISRYIDDFTGPGSSLLPSSSPRKNWLPTFTSPRERTCAR